jgi:predicted RNA-binding Zn-ribbon protein involved in translation (DUF1610 family)
MMEQSAVVQRALDALRAVCIAEPEPDRRNACHNGAAYSPLTAPACHQPIPSCDLAGWLVNGKRVTVFPHCPRCTSYALYRKDNLGDYECQTCGLMAISEEQARRVM